MYRHAFLHDFLTGSFNVLLRLLGIDFPEDFQHPRCYFLKVDVLIIENIDLIDIVLLHFLQLIVLLQFLVAILLQDFNPSLIFLLEFGKFRILSIEGLDDALHLILLIMQILDFSDVVFLCVVEDLQQVVWLVLNGEMFTLLGFEGVFSEEHWVVVGTANVGLPVAFGVIERIDEFFESFKVIQYFRILRDEVVDLLCLCLNAVELGD